MKASVRFLLLSLFVLIAGCAHDPGSEAGGPNAAPVGADFRILSGSENKNLQPIVDRFAAEHHIHIGVDYSGSVDIMLALQSGKVDYDAVWPANSSWLTLGDTHHMVKNDQSVLWSPVVIAIKTSRAKQLGWIDKKNVRVEDFLSAVERDHLKFMMTSATQSNSGSAAYLGFLYAFAGQPGVLTPKDLANPTMREKVRRLLASVDRSSGSSGWLKDLFLQKYETYDAMVNYESVAIEANQALTAAGKEPLYLVYPSDGLAIVDSPFAYIDHGDGAKAATFKALQDYLLSPLVQSEFLQQGRRTGPVGADLSAANPSVFNPAWGVDVKRFLRPIRYPSAEVVREALDLYQTALRKPSYTVYCLDFSGSMEGAREMGLKAAMRLILNQEEAEKSLLQSSPGDVTTVITFSDHIMDEWTVQGNRSSELKHLFDNLNARHPQGGTDIYSPIMRGLDLMKSHGGIEHYFPSVILLTDGESNTGATLTNLQEHVSGLGLKSEIPIYAIQFGEASGDQLKLIAQVSSGRLFDGKADLAQAFRTAKGYN